MRELQVGLEGESSLVVTGTDTARAVGSGTVEVLATPTLVALIERAAVRAVASALPPDRTSVGTEILVRHVAPTPPGLRVTARATLVEIDGRRLRFRVVAHDERELIAEGSHTRVVLDLEQFLSRARAKSTS